MSQVPMSLLLRVHHRRLPRLPRVVEPKPHDVASPLEQLVCDAGVPVLAAVVIAGKEAWFAPDVFEQREQRVRRALRLDGVFARLRRLDREVDLLAGREAVSYTHLTLPTSDL